MTSSSTSAVLCSQQVNWRVWVGLIAAPTLFLLIMIVPGSSAFDTPRRAAAAMTVAMAILWMLESIPLAVTALLPLVVLPTFGVAGQTQLAAAYGNDLIFLFLGGFILANGIEHHRVHQRFTDLILRHFKSKPRHLVAGLMFTTMLVSFFVANTTTALLMMPIGMSVVRSTGIKGGPFGKSMVLGIAAACSIGGLGTPIGSTPNLLFTSEVKMRHSVDTGFFQWIQMGTPLAIMFTLAAWALLVFWLFPVPAHSALATHSSDHAAVESPIRREPINRCQIIASVIIALTTMAWIFRESRVIAGWHFGVNALIPAATDGTIAIAGALAMVALPVSLKPVQLLTPWEKASQIPWDIVLLFGGGMAMASGIQSSGLDSLLAQWLRAMGFIPPWAMLLLFSLAGLLLSELASNTAAAAVLLPVASAMSTSIDHNPIFLMLPVALTTSMGFMLPTATPPNALALASEEITVSDMIKVGAVLNVVGLILAIATIYLLGFPAYGVLP